MKNIMSAIQNELDLRLCCVQLIDCHYCCDPGIFYLNNFLKFGQIDNDILLN